MDGSRIAVVPLRYLSEGNNNNNRKTFSRRLATKVGRPDPVSARKRIEEIVGVLATEHPPLRTNSRNSTLNRCLAVSIFHTNTVIVSEIGRAGRGREK